MKKLISFLLVLAMLACFMAFPASAEEPTEEVTTASVSGSHVTAEDGSSTTVTFTTTNASGFCAFKYRLSYDSEHLTVNSVGGAGVIANTNTAGVIIVTFANAENVTSHSFSVNFTVNGKCATFPVGLSVEQLFAFDANSDKVVVPFGASGGSVTVPHVPGETVKENEVAATCTKAGSYDLVTYCSVCGEEISRETIVVPVTDHIYEKDGKLNYGFNDDGHWLICVVCGHTTEVEAHDHIHQRDGYYWCECGHRGGKVPVKDPDLDDVPQTGDITPYVTFGTVAMISMAAAAAYVFKRKIAK